MRKQLVLRLRDWWEQATGTEGNCDYCGAKAGSRCNPFRHGLFLGALR